MSIAARPAVLVHASLVGACLALFSLPAGAAFDPARLREDVTIAPFVAGVNGYGVSTTGLAAVDLDGDGRDELVLGYTRVWHVLSWDRTNGRCSPRRTHEVSGADILRVRVGDVDGDGGPDVVVLQADGTLSAYDARSGAPKGTQQLSPRTPKDLQVANLDSGPQAELVVVDRDDLWVYRFGTADPVWTFPGAGGRETAIGNVDADPALEIVVATGPGITGMVLDATSHLVEWIYTPGFGNTVSVGDVDGDGRAEVLAWQTGTYDSTLQLVDGSTHLERWEKVVYETGGRACLADVDGDGRAEVLHLYGRRLAVLEGASGQERYTLSSGVGPWNSDTVVVGDVRGGCGTDLVWAGAEGLAAASDATRSVVWNLVATAGPFPFAAGDLSGDGRVRLVWESDVSWGGEPLLFVSDLARDRLDYASPGRVSFWAAGAGVALAQLDDDPALELVRDDSSGYDHASVYDAASLERQWSTADLPSSVTAVAAADVVGDARSEVLVGTNRSFVPGRVWLYSADGTLLWSVPVPDDPSRLLVADLDGQPGREVLATDAYGGTVVLDGETGAEKWFVPDARCAEVADVDSDGDADYLVGTSAGELQAFDGATRAPLFQVAVGSSVNAIRVADLDGDGVPEIVVATSLPSPAYVPPGDVRVLRASDRALLWRSPEYLGPVGSVGLLVADVDGDGKLEIACDTSVAIHTFEYDPVPPDANPPVWAGQPGITAALPAGDDSCCPAIDLSWGRADDASPPVTYRVYRSSGSLVTPSPATLLAETTFESYRDTAVTPVQGYAYAVRAVDRHGNEDENAFALSAVAPAPVAFSLQPVSVFTCLGAPATFTVALTRETGWFEWTYNGYPTSYGGDTLAFLEASLDDAATYRCVLRRTGCAPLVSAPAVLQVDVVRGDVDADCSVTPHDLFRLVSWLQTYGTRLVGTPDVNADGRLDLQDANLLFDYLYAGGAAPPSPPASMP